MTCWAKRMLQEEIVVQLWNSKKERVSEAHFSSGVLLIVEKRFGFGLEKNLAYRVCIFHSVLFGIM